MSLLTLIFQVDWTKWWGNPRDANSREHIEIKVMKDIAPSARDGRCVLWRASTNYDDVFSKFETLHCFAFVPH